MTREFRIILSGCDRHAVLKRIAVIPKYITYSSRDVPEILCILEDLHFLSHRSPSPPPTSPSYPSMDKDRSVDIFYSWTKPPRSRYALTCRIYSSDDAWKKRRFSNTFSTASPAKVARWPATVRNGVDVSYAFFVITRAHSPLPLSESKDVSLPSFLHIYSCCVVSFSRTDPDY